MDFKISFEIISGMICIGPLVYLAPGSQRTLHEAGPYSRGTNQQTEVGSIDGGRRACSRAEKWQPNRFGAPAKPVSECQKQHRKRHPEGGVQERGLVLGAIRQAGRHD